jgi:(E)-4-hydroxy-3-methylbut-2-enyl-diphosphate synthase
LSVDHSLPSLPYVASPYVTRRRRTREVRVGDVGIGGDNPIRVQSMTNTDTMNTMGTVGQIERLADAGCEIARVTAPSIHDAENLETIVAELRGRGVRVPLVADIHFTPNAAMIAANFVEKVRINPGNYADKKKFEVREYSDDQYRVELERVGERFRPLARRCKQNGVAMRIGTNHGSLSDRVMNRYGDSPLGMVESALEFLDVCEDEGYHDIVFSMKASNSHVAIQAYRLLAARLAERGEEGGGYPFHLGVTEAGDSLDGRIKSAIGIGSLLEDGIGDTVRVSLTEDPVREIPVAQLLAQRYDARWAEDVGVEPIESSDPFVADPYHHVRRTTRTLPMPPLELGGEEPVRVELCVGSPGEHSEIVAKELAASLARVTDVACEGLAVELPDEQAAARLSAFAAALRTEGLVLPLAVRMPAGLVAVVGVSELASRLVVRVDARTPFGAMKDVATSAAIASTPLEWALRGDVASIPALADRALEASGAEPATGLAFSVSGPRASQATRRLVAHLDAAGAGSLPVVLGYARTEGTDDDLALIEASIDLGGPLCDGIGDAVSLSGFHEPARALDVAYRILQGARQRTTRTEFISCPSCGRTLFDLEETTAKIKARTEHLSGVKIGIMGCIVNGPGEMADADFGYVGSGPGVVTLYVGQEVVSRSVPEVQATDRLVDLIKEHGAWREPESTS